MSIYQKIAILAFRMGNGNFAKFYGTLKFWGLQLCITTIEVTDVSLSVLLCTQLLGNMKCLNCKPPWCGGGRGLTKLSVTEGKVMLVGVARGVVSDLDLVVFVDLTEMLFQKVLHFHYLSVVLVRRPVGTSSTS